MVSTLLRKEVLTGHDGQQRADVPGRGVLEHDSAVTEVAKYLDICANNEGGLLNAIHELGAQNEASATDEGYPSTRNALELQWEADIIRGMKYVLNLYMSEYAGQGRHHVEQFIPNLALGLRQIVEKVNLSNSYKEAAEILLHWAEKRSGE